ncbi:MAG: hypothetical protein J6J38_07710 [Lachnospiraceae bacterium]|nr:hypothetical protein [Lachnospiraceae bacterium]
MDREELFHEAMSCLKPPEDSVLIATEELTNNVYTFWQDKEGNIWYTSTRTDAIEAEMQEAARRLKAEKRKTSDATRKEASEEPVMQNTLTEDYEKSIA